MREKGGTWMQRHSKAITFQAKDPCDFLRLGRGKLTSTMILPGKKEFGRKFIGSAKGFLKRLHDVDVHLTSHANGGQLRYSSTIWSKEANAIIQRSKNALGPEITGKKKEGGSKTLSGPLSTNRKDGEH